MAILRVNENFIDGLKNKDEWKKVLKIYGMDNDTAFWLRIFDSINSRYPWIGVDRVLPYSSDKSREYGMYNGYIEGDFHDCDEITVSFSDVYTKEGNTIISQQLMPMLKSKIENAPDFLYRKRIKRFFFLTSHKTSTYEPQNNFIKDPNKSSLQMLVRCLVTMGFDIFEIIKVKNLDTAVGYSTLKEFLSNVNFLTASNSGNVQYEQIKIIDGNKVVGSFFAPPKGQEEKYFALRYLTAMVLNEGYTYDVSQAVIISGGSQQMKMLQLMANYVNKVHPRFDREVSDKEFEFLIVKEDIINRRIAELAQEYGEDGTTMVSSIVRVGQVQKIFRDRLIKKHGCKCMLCSIESEEMLIASHIKAAAVSDIHEKADAENGFLLCANHDRLFDRFLISFDAFTGEIMISKSLTNHDKRMCCLDPNYCLPQEFLTAKRTEYLLWHNDEFVKREEDIK